MWSEAEGVVMHNLSWNLEPHLIYSLHGHTEADISVWLQQPGCQLRQPNTTTNFQLVVRPNTKNPKQSNHLKQTESTAPWARSQFTHFQGKNPHCILLRSLSVTSTSPTHSCIDKCAKPGGLVCYIFLSELVYAHWGMHVHTQRVCGVGVVMRWQEYHTYFPLRESLSLLWDRKTTSMTKHMYTHTKQEKDLSLEQLLNEERALPAVGVSNRAWILTDDCCWLPYCY